MRSIYFTPEANEILDWIKSEGGNVSAEVEKGFKKTEPYKLYKQYLKEKSE